MLSDGNGGFDYDGDERAIAAIYNAGSAGKCAYAIGTNSPSHGTIVCDTLAASGYDSVCTLTPNTGYYLSALTDNTIAMLGSVVAGTYTIPSVTEVHTLEATFSEYMIKRVSLSDYYYNLLSEAFGVVADNDAVMLRQGSFTGSAYDRDGVSITLKGGYKYGIRLEHRPALNYHRSVNDKQGNCYGRKCDDSVIVANK